MIEGEPVPRRNLFSNSDADAWKEQFFFLFYTLHMTPMQIAQIDYGLDPEHPHAFAAFSWADQIRSTFPRMDVAAMIEAARAGKGNRGPSD